VSFLTDEPLDARTIAAAVMRNSDGACLVFEGVVRDHHQGRAVESIDYEAYRPMAEKEIETIVKSIREQFPDVAIVVRHRLGHLVVGDVSIVIAASAPHRGDAFAACRAAIDRIKETVPIWKKERGPEGESWSGWQNT
jgi:molybdopterin synthase catalytic subunit